ncbi:vascular endothelial growth factor A-A-like [Formica exsecta]|uniref:vascular endothelial growth factor A-A-like n=1 Tax=Formica exsecta TaxID=72781 RepID=UPI001144219F|nr:vascular endothelial growth factor A-A-like [Formica exsecta]
MFALGAEMREAIQHAMQVNREGSCQWPRARVIPVRDVYPSPSTTYVPHCAILHRCSDDTGCCRSEALTCVPKHSHRVELFFYTANVAGGTVVEKLSFYNHTECECRERSKYDTTNEKFADQRVYRHSSSPPQNMKKPPSRKPCRCPSEFTPRITLEGACQCNCYDSNQNCIKTRRGKGYFSLADRICIQSNECAMPNCEFGEYMKRPGKCPGKRDTFNAMAGSAYRTNLNHRFRS